MESDPVGASVCLCFRLAVADVSGNCPLSGDGRVPEPTAGGPVPG